jgi:hypothetical protein
MAVADFDHAAILPLLSQIADCPIAHHEEQGAALNRQTPVVGDGRHDFRRLRHNITYVELAKRLKKHGFKGETEASITNKLARGSFPATFFLACLAALELDGVALEEI